MLKPNILFVFADQLRYNALGANGSQVVRTPNIDRLAAAGLVFDQAFSCCPVCSPYRGQILTGRYAHQNGVVDNEYRLRPDLPTLPQVLKENGYRTGFVGKWHLGCPPYPEEKRYGFDYLAAYNCGHQYYQAEYFENERGPIKIDGWAPTAETSLAIRFMEEQARDESAAPFLLMLGWAPPHWPYDQYPDEFKTYKPEAVDLPPNVPEQFAAFARQEIAHYYGNITALDREMGRLLEALDKLGLAENTIFVFTSDHGDHLSSYGYGKPSDQWMHPSRRVSKMTPHEESIHIPFIVRFPGRATAGGRSQVMLNSVDVMPTLLGLCGVKVPEGVQGKSLAHAVRGEAGPEPDSVYLQILGPGWPNRLKWAGLWRGVRTSRWTYARWHNDDDGPWLFDRENDPHEMTNLAGREEHREVQEKLEARLQRWLRETEDPFETGEREPETGMLLLGQELIRERSSYFPKRKQKAKKTTSNQRRPNERGACEGCLSSQGGPLARHNE